ncbi:hypothetical protein [Burkholderia territorii]|nr:hypothetical protein [Burkholderia territorii]
MVNETAVGDACGTLDTLCACDADAVRDAIQHAVDMALGALPRRTVDELA